MKSVIIFVNSLYDPKTVESTLSLVVLILIITKSHNYLCEIICILVLFEVIEDVERSLLRFNRLIKVLGFRKHFCHFKVSVTELFLLQKWVRNL